MPGQADERMDAFAREARIGMGIIGILLLILLSLAYYRFAGWPGSLQSQVVEMPIDLVAEDAAVHPQPSDLVETPPGGQPPSVMIEPVTVPPAAAPTMVQAPSSGGAFPRPVNSLPIPGENLRPEQAVADAPVPGPARVGQGLAGSRESLNIARQTGPGDRRGRSMRDGQLDLAGAEDRGDPRTERIGGTPTLLAIPGDSYWTISERIYGSGRWFRALHRHNRSRLGDLDLLPPGTEVEIPTAEQLARNWRELVPDDLRDPLEQLQAARRAGQVYLVKANETMFEIARDQLGQASRFGELLELNRWRIPQDADQSTPLPAGLELVLPKRLP